MPIDYNFNNVSTSGTITATSGIFANLSVNETRVSISGHTHSSSDITDFNSSVSGLLPVKNILGSGYASVSSVSGAYTVSVTGLQPSGNYAASSHTHTSSNVTDFNSSVSGLLPTITNSGNNRLLTSTGSSVGINAESNLTFDGSYLISPSAVINNLLIGSDDPYLFSPSYKIKINGDTGLLTSQSLSTSEIILSRGLTPSGSELRVYANSSGAIFASNIQNNTNSYSILADTQLNTTQNGTAIVRGISNEVKNVITTGITNSGSMIGIDILSLRNHLVSNDAGTLASLYGLNINYGHGIQQAVTPTTNNAYGIVISPFRGSGTITNAYDIYLAPDVYATGTMTNHYGIYQAQNNWNYFAGNVGIGVVQPSGNNKLQVDGTARINSTVLVVGDGATASVTCTNYTANAQGPQLFLRKSRGTEASGTVVNTNDNLGSLNFQGRNTSGVHVSSSRIRGLCEVTPTGEFVAGQLAFGVSTETVAVADKMWLSSNGSLDIDGNTIRLRSSRTISSSTNTGSTGEVCWDSSYLYLCIATNTWRRISLGSSF